MVLFYNSQQFDDTLMINLDSLPCENVVQTKDYAFLFNNNQLVGINIFHISKYISLNEGMIYPTEDLLMVIKMICGIDLSTLKINPIMVAKILSFSSIPNTHLSLCNVDVGLNEPLEIVCGAPNVRENMFTVAALDGAVLPSGISIKNGELMGHKSFGMLCSPKELGLVKDAPKGIIDLPCDEYEKLVGTHYKGCYR